ncbi:hypothetical protein [Streptomyces sindenensis]|uniref:Uncharacterized protein n=1 Tax=Streptomyces sindenensis TaxID=67363 RepID=A0ABW6ERH9_9ACTN
MTGRPRVCRARLDPARVDQARAADVHPGPYAPGDMAEPVLCALEDHPARDAHHGIIRYLDLRSPGEIWATWHTGDGAHEIEHRADCPEGDCTTYAGHPGAHSWQVSRP